MEIYYFCTEIFEIIRYKDMQEKDCKSIKAKILQRIRGSSEHSVFFLNDFADLTSLETVRKVLSQACDSGLLTHVTHGIYAKPMMSRFGEVPVPLEKIAKEIAERDHVQIMPTGSTAANILGLSTQVTMTVSYLTTGSSRIINIGNRTIKFRHAAPRNFAYKGSTIPLIVQAFKELGKENIKDKELSIVSQYMSSANDQNTFAEDVLLAPMWIQNLIKQFVKAENRYVVRSI